MPALRRKRLMGSILFILAVVYGILILAGLFLSDSMMFLPGASSYRDSTDIIKLTLADGSQISARLFENPSARYTIIFSHGNAEDMGDLSGFMEEFRQNGFSVMAYDYSGYGTSDGKPSEQAALSNIEVVYDYLTTKRGVAPERIIAWGRSIGSGPSVHLAATRKVGGLVIESGFTSAFCVMTRIRLLPFDKFDNLRGLEHITCPVLVIHGREDEIIPFRHGEQLYDAARQPKMNFWVDRAGHNDLSMVAGRAYWDTAHRFELLLADGKL
jgi:fermentation-respiration switch protein FrsA (DUF1100 family)